MSETVFVALGTNEGDRYHNLLDAKEFLSRLALPPLSCSSIYETEPVGPSTHFYLNAVIAFQTDLSPDDLLERFRDYEARSGRDMNAPRWSDRIIDLDIIAYGHQVISTSTLTIPHPEYSNRLFVLRPMEDIAPDWTDPESGKSLKEMITQAPQIIIEKSKWHW